MRATRAYLASLGTTGLLVLAAFVILIAASALLAFNGWPGEEAPDRATPVLIDPGRDLAPAGGPLQVAAEAAEAADDVASVPVPAPAGDGGGDGPSGGGPDDGSPGDPGDRGPGGGTPGTPSDPSPPGGGGGDTPEPPAGGGGVALPGGGTLLPRGDVSLTDGLADGVESATAFLGTDTVSQLSPELGAVVTGTGQVLTDLVRALDGAPAPARR
ncbi:MAG: hypothetical protein WD844_04965 [Thermoleophilaceae bacterium]